MLIHLALTISSATLLAAVSLAPSLLAGNDKNYNYLALGDSVAYGLDVRLLTNTPPPAPSAFTGYPEVVSAFEHLLTSSKEVNASCPGETSGSFIDTTMRDYGCHSPGPQGQPPFKSSIGLHTNYDGSQLNFAISQLSTNTHINMVTLGIGSNDALLLIKDCNSDMACVQAGLPGILQTFGQNLAQILTAIRTQAHYTGTLVLVKYYSPEIDLNPVAQAINGVMDTVGSQFKVRFADGYTAFQLASAFFGGDPCKAGLLIHLTPTTCDIHPSPAGRDLLAAAVEVSLIGAPR